MGSRELPAGLPSDEHCSTLKTDSTLLIISVGFGDPNLDPHACKAGTMVSLSHLPDLGVQPFNMYYDVAICKYVRLHTYPSWGTCDLRLKERQASECHLVPL